MKLLTTILFFITYFLGNAQSYHSDNITSLSGLPNNAIRSIFEDSRGYMWIGTDAGVSKWDGETFKTYNTLDGLAGNKVWWIDEDKDGNLWFACFGGGISKFDGNIFISYTSNDGLVDNSVRVVKYSTALDCLLVGTNKSISVLKDSVFYNFSKQNGELKSDVIITSILADSNKAVFIDFLSNYYRLSINNDNVPVLSSMKNTWLDSYNVSSCFINSFGNTIIGWEREGIAIYNGDSTREINDIGQVLGMAEDCLENIWIASWNGGISPPGGLFVLQDTEVYSLNKAYKLESIFGWTAFYENKQNLVFYGTLDNGLYKIPPRFFEYYRPEYFSESSFAVKDIEIDEDNNIWILSDSLLVFWDKKSYKKINSSAFYDVRYQYEVNSNSKVNLDIRIKTLNKNYKNKKSQFSDIEIDSKNNTWASITNLGLYNILDADNLSSVLHTGNVSSKFVFDEKDTLFQSNRWQNHIQKFIDFNKSNEYLSIKDSLHPIFTKNIYNFQNEIWACSRISGVFMYKNGELKTITSKDSTINKIVNDICFDTEGYAYLGGSDGRIEILAPETRVKVFEINHEEYDNSIHWLKISKNKLFVGYSDGLRVYSITDIKDNKSNCQFFGASEGYSVQIVNSSRIDKDGNIWLGTNDGLVKIATDFFVECNFQPLTTVIQKVDVFNKDIDWNQTGNINPWSGLPLETPKLNPDQNHISIYFHALNYNNPDADQYYYKLDGIDKDWIGSTDKKSVVYPYLHSGKYKFLVKSKNELSGLFTQPAEFKFVILTPWYQQIWFYIFLAFFVITFFILFFNIRLRNMRKKEESKRNIMQKISELETKALQAQMNPHFLFNSINSIQSYILDNDVDEALSYLSSFSKIIRMTLEFVNTKFVSLRDVLDYLTHYVNLENMRFDDLFDYVVVIDNQIDPETTLIPPMLLQTLIENSIKHGIRNLKHKGTIKLEIVKIDNESFKCIIEDNGVGRLKSSQINKDQNIKKESLGLKIIKERLDILNNGENGLYQMEIIDLYSDIEISTGTRVEITLAFILP